MHIMEAYLPVAHAIGWSLVSTPFVGVGLSRVKKAFKEKPELKMTYGLAAAFTFVLSALKLPSLTGSCSHPTGTGLGALLLGPWVMAPIALVVLLFQALLMAHGGLSTLGANVFSMGIVGPMLAYGVFRLGKRLTLPLGLCVFMGVTLGNLMTYVTTSLQLAMAFPASQGGILASFFKFSTIFALTQVPLSIVEGLLTLLMFNSLSKYAKALGWEGLSSVSEKG